MCAFVVLDDLYEKHVPFEQSSEIELLMNDGGVLVTFTLINFVICITFRCVSLKMELVSDLILILMRVCV